MTGIIDKFRDYHVLYEVENGSLLIERFRQPKLTYKEIGEKMFCSPRTVESYRDGLFEKFGLKTRLGLVLYALRKGIIKL